MSYLFKGLFSSLLFLCSMSSKAQNLNIDILKPINANETGFKNNLSSFVANSVTVVNAGVPVAYLTVGLVKHDKKLVRDAAFIAGAYLFSTLVTQGTKRLVNEKRPFETWPFIVNRSEESGGLSFPSGHTSAAFCTATSLSLYNPKWYVVVPSYLWASTVAWARMYQGAHYPGDVVAGALVGAGSAWLGHYIQQRFEKKSKTTKSTGAL